MDETTEDLERRARTGDTEAQLALGRRYEALSETAHARNWFAHAARAGSAEAAYALGMNLLTQDPIRADAGVTVIGDAERRGSAEASYICAMLAAQDDALPNRFDIALSHIRNAASRGHAYAQAELKFFDGIDPGELSSPLPLREVSRSPRIAVIAACAPLHVCDWLIAQAARRLHRAEVYDPAHGGGRHENARSNSTAEFDIGDANLALSLLRQRMAATAGLSFSSLERPQILHYAVGQEFTPHFDFLDPGVPAYARDIGARGQRIATFLIYLNDDYEGGETEFPRLAIKHKARKGDGLLFWNLDSDRKPDPRMLHAGLPPTSGEKWVLSQWLRDR